jgi:hypothetical protein
MDRAFPVRLAISDHHLDGAFLEQAARRLPELFHGCLSE